MNYSSIYHPFGNNPITDALQEYLQSFKDTSLAQDEEIQTLRSSIAHLNQPNRPFFSLYQDPQFSLKTSEQKSSLFEATPGLHTAKTSNPIQASTPHPIETLSHPTDLNIEALRTIGRTQYRLRLFEEAAKMFTIICGYTMNVAEDWNCLYQTARKINTKYAQTIFEQMQVHCVGQ